MLLDTDRGPTRPLAASCHAPTSSRRFCVAATLFPLTAQTGRERAENGHSLLLRIAPAWPHDPVRKIACG